MPKANRSNSLNFGRNTNMEIAEIAANAYNIEKFGLIRKRITPYTTMLLARKPDIAIAVLY